MQSDAPAHLRRRARLTALGAVVAGLALVAAGCGGGSGPDVAQLTSTASSSTPSQASGAGSATAGGGSATGGGANLAIAGGKAGLALSECMRSHGVKNFPDPSSGGGIQITSSSGIDPSSPTFQAAQRACQKLLPGGGVPSPAQQAKMQKALLAFSACMRSHGITNFPDPTFSSNGARISINGGLDPQSPRFQAAQTACQNDLPGKGVGLKTRSAKP